MSFKCVIFDLDGTLLDTLEDLANSGNQALAAHNFPEHPVDAYRYFVGDGLSTLIQRILPQDQQTEAVCNRVESSFLEDYSQNWNVQSGIYTGVDTMLNGLQQAGLPLAILSNKPQDFTVACVEQMLSNWQFSPVLGARSGIAKKPDPVGAMEIAKRLDIAPSEILYLGDTATDMETANRAGMYPVGAAWGFRTVEELRESGAAKIIHTPEALLELL